MEKVKKVRINSDQENLIRLLEHHSPSDRQDFLNYIDKILCECFGIKRSELPWLDPIQSEIKWDNIIRLIRLTMTKVVYEYEKKERTLH